MIDREGNEEFNIILPGVAGQGAVLSAQILAKTAMKEGLKVRGTEVYGAAQRQEPVVSHVRMGEKVESPLISSGDADILLGFEPAEALRNCEYLKKKGLAIINKDIVNPPEAILGQVGYPPLENLLEPLEAKAKNFYTFNATDLSKKAGSVLTMNIVMLGALVEKGTPPFTRETLKNTIEEEVPGKTIKTNLKAYNLGMQALRES